MTEELSLDDLDQVRGGNVVRLPPHVPPWQSRAEEHELAALVSRIAKNAASVFPEPVGAAIRDASNGDAKQIVIDLRNVTFIDSSGLQALVLGHQLCQSRGYDLRIIRGPANVQRLFDLTGMTDVLPLYDPENLKPRS